MTASPVLDRGLATVERYCQSAVPPTVRDHVRWEASRRGNAVTIYERRAPWPGAAGADGEWTRRPMAQFRGSGDLSTWTLHWTGGSVGWHPVLGAPPSIDIDDLLRVVAANSSGLFD